MPDFSFLEDLENGFDKKSLELKFKIV